MQHEYTHILTSGVVDASQFSIYALRGKDLNMLDERY